MIIQSINRRHPFGQSFLSFFLESEKGNSKKDGDYILVMIIFIVSLHLENCSDFFLPTYFIQILASVNNPTIWILKNKEYCVQPIIDIALENT